MQAWETQAAEKYGEGGGCVKARDSEMEDTHSSGKVLTRGLNILGTP